MSTQRVGQGIALLVSSVGSSFVCVILSLLVLSSAFTSVLKKERAARLEHHSTVAQQKTVEGHTIQHLSTPAKNSLIVNLNAASAEELESLPGIASSRADQIITHRPYSSVDELSRLKGITLRVINQLRPFAKTDGATEKLQSSDRK